MKKKRAINVVKFQKLVSRYKSGHGRSLSEYGLKKREEYRQISLRFNKGY